MRHIAASIVSKGNRPEAILEKIEPKDKSDKPTALTTDPTDNAKKPETKAQAETGSTPETAKPADSGARPPPDYKAAIARLRNPVGRSGATAAAAGSKETAEPEIAATKAPEVGQKVAPAPPAAKPAPPTGASASRVARHATEAIPGPPAKPERKPSMDDTAEAVAAIILDGIPGAIAEARASARLETGKRPRAAAEPEAVATPGTKTEFKAPEKAKAATDSRRPEKTDTETRTESEAPRQGEAVAGTETSEATGTAEEDTRAEATGQTETTEEAEAAGKAGTAEKAETGEAIAAIGTETEPPAAAPGPPRRRRWPLAIRVLIIILAIPLLLAALLYGRLLFGPIDLSFFKPSVEQAIRDSLPSDGAIELGNLSLSISANFSPVLHFEPVVFTDTSTGARVSIDALEIGISPLLSLIGQPAAVIILVNPHLQLLQDLLGPRLAAFTEHRDPETGDTVVEIKQGKDVYPEVRIGAAGLQVSGPSPRGDGVGLRSDNDWLIYNFDALEASITSLETQAREGRFARLIVRGGTMETVDPVLGIVRRLDNLAARIVPGANGRPTSGTLGAALAGRTITGSFTRENMGDGLSRLDFSLQNFDFATLMPALDDPDSLLAVKGGGTLAGTLDYGPEGKVSKGRFDIDLTHTELRLKHDYFPVGAGRFFLDWDPKSARFELSDAPLVIGRSSTRISGEFVLGLDDDYGPTVSAALTLGDLSLVPNDMQAPKTPFSEVSVRVWSAPLYGTLGFDRVVAKKPGVEIRAKGRFDLVRHGIGVDLEVGGEGASADDLKRLWPYFIARGGRDWFVSHVISGHMNTGSLKFKLPVGVLDPEAEDRPLPAHTAWIDLVGSDVTLIPTEGFRPVTLGGDAKLKLRDNKTSVTVATTQIVSDKGQFTFSNGAVEIDGGVAHQTVVEFSGDVKGQIPALVGFAESQSPGVIEGFGLPFDARKVNGTVDGSAVVTMTFGEGPTPIAIDYAVNGSARDFSSKDRIADRMISNGQLNFQATADNYHVAGTADLDGVPAELVLDGGGDNAADIKVASTIDVNEFKKFGFDISNLMSGKIRFVAKPLDDGGLQLAADLTEAQLNLKDVGLSKPMGIPGTISAEIRNEGTLTKVSQIDLNFAQVRVKGTLDYDSDKGLVSAEFSDFALSQGDSAQLTVEPGTKSGYKVTLTGDQFDLKPMLKRYFALDKTSTGSPQATSVPQELVIDAKLKRALGYYGVTAYNVEFALDLRGEELLDASLQAQFTDGNSVSLTSNPTTGGRLMTVAFNDAGTILRFLDVYPRLLGGSGSLTLRTNVREHVDYGEIRLKDFSIVDEAKVAEIIGNHKDSQKLIAKENRLNFQNAQATFVRRSDRIELTDAVLDGGSIGGTLKGFIYTKARQYDLTGTYIPLFGLNNLFQKLPLIGTILGGREGEGLVGVTYAVRGDLDKPEFIVNPASILAPGIFRSLFEFRATEAPRENQTQ